MNVTAFPSLSSPAIAVGTGGEVPMWRMTLEGWRREVERRMQEMHHCIKDDRTVDELALGTLAVNAELAS
ncbi:MAG: hypothetical protein ACRERD_30455 [Candidatus Binatia bacterium]